jgi:ribonuclease BN (tRNA processing enzyme)
MVVIVLPEWYGKAEKIIDDAIKDASLESGADYFFVKDSITIKEGKEMILNAMLRISEQVNSRYVVVGTDTSRKTKTKSKTGGKKNG